MFERMVERVVMPVRDALEREPGRLDVLCIGSGRVAPVGPRELVEREDQCEPPLRRRRPVVEISPRGGLGLFGEIPANDGVHAAPHTGFPEVLPGLGSSVVHIRREPQVQDLIRRFACPVACHCSAP